MTVQHSRDSDNLPMITFGGRDLRFISKAGLQRRLEAIEKKQKSTKFFTEGEWDGWGQDIEAAFGEAAAAAFLNIFWGPGETKDPDVGKYQVRTAPRPSKRLIIRPRDSIKDTYIFVTGWAPTYTIQGWITGEEGMNREWLQDPNNAGKPVYLVPRYKLKHPDLLKRQHLEIELQKLIELEQQTPDVPEFIT